MPNLDAMLAESRSIFPRHTNSLVSNTTVIFSLHCKQVNMSIIKEWLNFYFFGANKGVV